MNAHRIAYFALSAIHAVIAAVLTQPPAVPGHAGPLRDLLGALLVKDPSRRPGAATVARALARQRSGPLPAPRRRLGLAFETV